MESESGRKGTWMNEEQKREDLKCGMLVDHPGHWMVSGTKTEESDYRSWSVVRKPEGTYWQVASMDFFPRSGGTLKVETGDQIVDEEALAYCEDVYARWLKKSAEERASMMKPLFGNLTCEICSGTMTKVSEIEAVCTQNETHRRKLKENVSS